MDIDTGVASFLPPLGSEVRPAAVAEAVEAAGFSFLWLDLELHGTLSRTQDVEGAPRLALIVAGSEQRFGLDSGESAEERAAYARLEGWLDEPERAVAVSGRVQVEDVPIAVLRVREAQRP